MKITIDNASYNDAALGLLKGYHVEVNKTIYSGECLYVRCVAHILNLIMSDGLKDVNQLIDGLDLS